MVNNKGRHPRDTGVKSHVNGYSRGRSTGRWNVSEIAIGICGAMVDIGQWLCPEVFEYVFFFYFSLQSYEK